MEADRKTVVIVLAVLAAVVLATAGPDSLSLQGDSMEHDAMDSGSGDAMDSNRSTDAMDSMDSK